ncbi:phage tail length tape measure family protein [Frigoribacterium sp. VKM Ac-2836]|uniref:phage tail protein n=1 Tax=Frigoribacterium sp. VKM Ac-2836 TaxID=2739014 RepID=UPI00156482F8|nr:phage tail length tape measure family protein [Frigoribacterium sp. VKM Ac-2836]NRD25554.1 phage tail length tape measure family protein [Frigoribacterium sp. VKM Ac-2836]
MAGQTVIVSILADGKKATQGLGEVASSFEKLGKITAGFAVGAGIAIGAVALGVGKLVADSIAAAAESEKVAAQTDAVVKSTGMAAGRSSEQIGDLALRLSNLTGIDDEVVQSASNIVATFTQIKGDQFDATTAAALDMSTALGTDASSAAQMLGKALNDPIAGIGKLSKAGVTFTDQQKAQIKAMTEAGDVAGAQGVILAEVQKEFGGSAEAYGNTFLGLKDKVSNAFGNIQETFGSAFLPVLSQGLGQIATLLQNVGESDRFLAITQSVADFVGGLLAGAPAIGSFIGPLAGAVASVSPLGAVLSYVSQNLGSVLPAFQAFGAALGSAFIALAPVAVTLLTSLGNVLGTVIGAVMPVVVGLIGTFAGILTTLVPVIAQVASTIGGALITILTTLAPIIAQLVTALGPLLTTILTALAPIITIVATTIGTLLTAIMPLITGAILPLVSAVLTLITPLLQLAVMILTPLIQLFVTILTPILGLVSVIVGALVPVIGFLVNILTVVIGVITGALTGAVNGITALFNGGFAAGIRNVGKVWGDIWNTVQRVFTVVVAAVRAGVSALVGFFSGVWGSIVSGISGFATSISNGIGNVVGFFRELPGRVVSAIGNLGSLLLSAGGDIINGLVNGVRNSFGKIGSIAADIGRNLLSGVKGALGIASPSRRMKELGKFAIQGFAGGLSDLTPVRRAMSSLTDLVTTTPTLMATADFSGSGAGRAGVVNYVTVEMLSPTPQNARLLAEMLDDHARMGGAR